MQMGNGQQKYNTTCYIENQKQKLLITIFICGIKHFLLNTQLLYSIIKIIKFPSIILK